MSTETQGPAAAPTMDVAEQLAPRTLRDGQICRIRVHDVATGAARTVFETTDRLYEAPNWTEQGQLIVNGEGLLWTLPADGSAAPTRIEFDGLPTINNDHVLAPGHDDIFLSADDGNLYSGPLAGGAVTALTTSDGSYRHFLHGVHPGGRRLAYVALEEASSWDHGTVRVLDLDSGTDSGVTHGRGRDDGPEYTPDGEWLYFNTERFSARAGHAQIARVREDGSSLTQLTFDERVNWFPHISPRGGIAVYLSFPAGTEGHPADLDVELRVVSDDAWDQPTTVAGFLGGQGTINVNSWAPDGSAFAFVDYPLR